MGIFDERDYLNARVFELEEIVHGRSANFLTLCKIFDEVFHYRKLTPRVSLLLSLVKEEMWRVASQTEVSASPEILEATSKFEPKFSVSRENVVQINDVVHFPVGLNVQIHSGNVEPLPGLRSYTTKEKIAERILGKILGEVVVFLNGRRSEIAAITKFGSPEYYDLRRTSGLE
ncbi:hypothetical protein [Leisingera sp. ANG-S5]|uniref:hypothetical protein n=1 Tax=Leisingera sp. ANG-S5 TaxID=1577901 RepID=UPI00126998E7|nr:hypothetical protein [Leisingera sp. ANG-S5]